MSNPTTIKDFANNPSNRIIRKCIAFLAFFAQLFILLLFLIGIIENFGSKIGVLSSVDLVIKLFSMSKAAIYLYLSNTFIGVLYIVALIVLIKSTIKSISTFSYLLKNKTGNMTHRMATDVLLSLFNDCIKWPLVFCVFACAFGEYELSSTGSLLFIVSGLVYILLCFLRSFLEDFTLETCLYKTTCSALFFIACAFITNHILDQSVFNIIQGFEALFAGIYQDLQATVVLGSVYKTIIFPILLFIAQMIFIKTVSSGLSTYSVNDGVASAAPSKSFFGFILAIVICDIGIKIASSGSSSAEFTTYFKYAKENLPLLLCGISLMLCFTFSNITNKKVFVVDEPLSQSENKDNFSYDDDDERQIADDE